MMLRIFFVDFTLSASSYLRGALSGSNQAWVGVATETELWCDKPVVFQHVFVCGQFFTKGVVGLLSFFSLYNKNLHLKTRLCFLVYSFNEFAFVA